MSEKTRHFGQPVQGVKAGYKKEQGHMGTSVLRHRRRDAASPPHWIETARLWWSRSGTSNQIGDPAHRPPSTMLPSGSLFSTINAGRQSRFSGAKSE